MSALALTVLLVALPHVAPAQQPVFRGGIEVIEVDTSVVDDKGHPVADLRGPEFTVTVDGKPRKVISAEFVNVRPVDIRARIAEPQTADSAFSSNASSVPGRLIV